MTSAARVRHGGRRRAAVRRLVLLSRPRFWPYLLGPWAVGVAVPGTAPSTTVLLLGLYFTLPANLLIYGVNDLFDRDTDRLNGKKGSYEALLDPSEDRWLAAAVLLVNAPFLGLVPFLPPAAVGWLAVFLVLGVGYSMPPLRLKARPGWDSASNFLYAAPGFAGFAAVAGAAPPPLLVVSAVLWCAAMHAYSAVPDIASDGAASLATIATRLGARRTVVLCLVLWVLSAVLVALWLPAFALLVVVVYGALCAASLRAVAGRGGIRLFSLYRIFPAVNTGVGAVLFFSVLFSLLRFDPAL